MWCKVICVTPGQYGSQPSKCGQQRTLNIVHVQTAAQQQSIGSYEARMSRKCGVWRDYFIMTLSPIHWVSVQDKGSKILCVKLWALKFTPSDPLHQKYLTINLGSTSDWRQLKLPLVRLFGRWRGRCWPGGAAWGRECRKRSSVLPLNLSDTAVSSQDGSSLEFIAPIAGRQCYI